MTEEIRGIVLEKPIAFENCCLFVLEQEDASYLVISTDRQAGKDNIFVEKGQMMFIKGSIMHDTKFKGVLLTEQARICCN